MGLRRTPPPGMAAPTSSRDLQMSEFPPDHEQPPELPSSPPEAPPAKSKSPTPKPTKEPTLSPKLPTMQPPSPQLPRITPRNSLFPSEEPDNTTPHAGLVNLARVINVLPTTPQRTTNTGAGMASHRRSVRRTPGAGRLNPLAPKLTARSPHASRAFERRAATPGRERRKSGRYPTARETPRDLLRMLSRQLAPTTAPYQPTPNPTPAPPRRASIHRDRRASDVMFYSDPGHESDDSSGDSDLPPPPRLSMNMADFEDDGIAGESPRFSMPLEDLDTTAHSIEFGRRAVSEQPWGGRHSFGIRLSDRFEDFAGGEVGEETVGEVTVGDVSVHVGDESAIGDVSVGGLVGIGGEEEEEGDVTMREELVLDPEDSYFLSLPGGDDAEDAEEEEDDEEQDEEDNGENQTNQLDQQDPTLRDLDLDDGLSTYDYSSAHAAHQDPKLLPKSTTKKTTRKQLPLSRHGHPLPPFPRATIKKLSQTLSGGANISAETLNAIVAASEAFFEQASEDLAAYAGHAGRKTIVDQDVIMLMRRQRQINPQNTVFSLAQRYLPRELLQEVKMPVVKMEKGKKGKKVVVGAGEEG